MATKYVFMSEDDAFGYPSQKIVHETKTESLIGVLEAFERFLRGSGFVFDGHLDIVEPETDIVDNNDDDFPPETFETHNTMDMPGTVGGATVIFNPEKGKCGRCGLTAEQMGGHKCYDQYCGLK